MEMRDPEFRDETLRHGDVRLPEMTGLAAKGPSRGKVILHLAGIGLGFLLLLVGLGIALSTGVWDRLPLVLVIGGGALVSVWIIINYRFLSSMFKNRRVLVGTNALFLALLAGVLLAMVNFISYRHYRKWDLTSVGLNTLSPKTVDMLDDLADPVTILVCNRAGAPRSPYRAAYESLTAMLNLYKEESGRITVEVLRPDVDPQKTTLSLESHGISANIGVLFDEVFVTTGERSKTLHLAEMMDYERDPMNPYATRPTAFKGEQFVTSAILEVISDKQPKLYFVEGHGERGITDGASTGVLDVAGVLKRDYFALEELSNGVPDAGVPGDCDCLVILGPKVPLASSEVQSISRYLDRGGRLFVCLDFEGESGLDGLLAKWGVKVGNDIVISQDARTLLGSPAAFLTGGFGASEITSPLAGFQVAFNFARSVSPVAVPGARATTLISSSAQSYAETDLATMRREKTSKFDEADVKGPISLAVVSSQIPPGGIPPEASPPPAAKLVVFGDVDVFSNSLMKLSMYIKNADLAVNSMNWLVERANLISIEARPEEQHVLVVDKVGQNIVFFLMVVGLPLAVLLCGGLVWAVRSYGSRAA